jgi:hypothetical protein
LVHQSARDLGPVLSVRGLDDNLTEIVDMEQRGDLQCLAIEIDGSHFKKETSETIVRLHSDMSKR